LTSAAAKSVSESEPLRQARSLFETLQIAAMGLVGR
jgi:hypothetical protein